MKGRLQQQSHAGCLHSTVYPPQASRSASIARTVRTPSCADSSPSVASATGAACVPQTISRQLYEVNGFRGAKQNYYDPDNSCINKVCPCAVPA